MQAQHGGTTTRHRRAHRHRGLSVTAAVGLLVALLPASAAAQATATPEEMAAATVRPAIVYLEIGWSAYVQDHDGDWLNGGQPYQWWIRCSGFVLNPSGYVGTAGHCVDDGLEGAAETAIAFGVDEWIRNGWAAESDRAALTDLARSNWTVEGEGANAPPDRMVYVQHGVATSGLQTGRAWPARVVEFSPWSQGDVALLKVEASNLPVVLLGADADISIGTEVLSVGYPGSSDMVTDQTLEPTYKDGKISSKKTREGGLLPVYEISAPLSGGMSGGPTVDLQGQVVGINSFGIVGEDANFSFVSPASLLREMLARNGATNELGPIDELYRTALASYFAGEYATAMEEFDLVLDRSPSHQQAQEYRTAAAQQAPLTPEDSAPTAVDDADAVASEDAEPVVVMPVTEETEGSFPIVPVGIGSLLLIAAAAAYLVRSRGARPVPAGATVPPGPSGTRHFCTECGAEVGDVRFCSGCGAAVPTLHPGG